jgi:hypothetical protein
MFFALIGCSPLVGLDPAALPPFAPAVVLTATASRDAVEVEGSIQAELYVDVDQALDDREGFRTQVLDAQGEVIYERSANGPILVQAFLDHWGEQAGLDVLGALPTLGRFQVQVPLLDGGETVNFQFRDADGGWIDVGDYDLSRVDADDVGVSPLVLDHATLQEGGPSQNRLDIVLIGDGFRESELDLFRTKADRVAEVLLGREPFASYAGLINVHRIDVASPESGASFDCDACGLRDTAFGSMFPVEAINRLGGTNYDSRAIFQIEQWELARAASVVPWDQVIVLVNTERPAGMAVHYATATTGYRGFAETAVHELGHTLGFLGDEYAADDCIRDARLGLPVNITNRPEDPPWMHFVEEGTPLPTPSTQEWRGTIGAFSPAYNCDQLYRPRQNCAMNAGDEFCPVCAEQLVRQILRHADPVDGPVLDGGKVRMDGPIEGVTLTWTRGDRVIATSRTGEAVSVGSRPYSVTAMPDAPEVVVGRDDLAQTWSVGAP